MPSEAFGVKLSGKSPGTQPGAVVLAFWGQVLHAQAWAHAS